MRHRALRLIVATWALAAGGAAARADTQFFTVLMDGKKAGYGKHVRTVAKDKVTSTEVLKITVGRGTTPITTLMSETCVETLDGKPLEFTSVMDMSLMGQTVKGVVGADGKVAVTITAGGQTRQNTMDWPEGALMAEGLRLLEKKKGLKKGTAYTAKVFTGTLMKAIQTQVVVGETKQVDLLGRVVHLTEVKATQTVPSLLGPRQQTTVSYVDDDGKALKMVMDMLGMKVEVIACAEEVAMSEVEVVDFLARALVASPSPLPNVRLAKSVTYHIAPTGEVKAKLPIPNTDNQKVVHQADGSVVVTVRPAKAPAGATFPYKGKDKVALAALKPTRFVESDDAKVIALARKAIGTATDAAKAAKRLEAFARMHVTRKDLSVGYATAAEVAVSRQGDCSEHAVLLAAMCRAVGIPAQVVNGLVYVPKFANRRHVFGPHAWVRAYVGGRWIGLDAAMPRYDAGRIALGVGDGNAEDFFVTVSIFGRIKITKVHVEK